MTATTIRNADWLRLEETRLVADALGPGNMRFVGGAVRDTLLGRAITDIDIATSLSPTEVMRRLKEAGIKAVAPGLLHGTVTAITHSRSFEITSLRIDAETFGRRARVEFTDDWALDASRRDFTINALYADADGTLYDPLGGLADLKGPTVRFIGDAAARIKEDALRILRFFRLSAELDVDAIDGMTLEAIRSLKHLLGTLSAERIRGELMKLLASPGPDPYLSMMNGIGILGEILPGITDLSGLCSLLIYEKRQNVCDPLRRLYALISGNGVYVQKIAGSLKLSRKECDRLDGMEKAIRLIGVAPEEQDLKESLYYFGLKATEDALYLKGGLSGEPEIEASLKKLDNLGTPVFPLHGGDLKSLGFAEGEELGKTLKGLEKRWIEGGFRATREALLKELKS